MNFRNNKTYIFIGLLVFFAVTILIPYFVFGAQSGTVEAKIFKSTEGPGIAYWINAVYVWSAGVIGIFAVATVIFAGIQYITSVGNQDATTKAKEKIGAALAGILLILLSYVILHTLDPRLVKIGFEIEELTLTGESVKQMTMEVPATQFKVATQAEAQTQCQNYCKNTGGTPTVTQAFATETGWECNCAGGKKPAECQSDADCQAKSAELCKQNNIDCEKNYIICKTETKICAFKPKQIDSQGNVVGKKLGEKCDNDAQCDSGFCDTAENECIAKEKTGGESCERDKECESKRCYREDECVPVGGFAVGHECQLSNATDCASKICIDRSFLRGDICATVGGSIEGEFCNNTAQCKKGSNLYCDNGGDDSNEYAFCRCPENSSWDSVKDECVKK